ncbi:uncharacterized protein [Chironomus tepperi]|uniref:uncharacterized protein n=1 Tax=Chironomus tepperi TaxID=113505 RepID=UPI00391F03E0
MKLVIFGVYLLSSILQMHTVDSQNIKKCDYTKDLFDDGRYLKTVCFMHQSVEHHLAEGMCFQNGMNLFTLNDEIVESHLLDAAQEKYTEEVFGLWINGRRDRGSKDWHTEAMFGPEPGPGLLSKNISFYSNHEPGDCLRITTKYTGIYNVLPGKCEEETWIACEHFKQTQKPPELDISRCFFHQHLYNKNKYIKTVCFTKDKSYYDQARRRCAGYGMNLFIFDSEETDESFFEATVDVLESIPGGYFWINGVRNPQNNEWSTYFANRKLKGPIYKDFEWVNLKGTHGISNGDNLFLSGKAGPYQGLGFKSDQISWIICEYYAKNI